MSEIDVAELEVKRVYYVNKAESARKKIKRLEESYDSLLLFKKDVNGAQGDFASINQSRNNILSSVEAIKPNCKTAQRYHEGMQNILDGIGTKTIGAVFRGLLTAIQLRQNSYLDSIDEQEINLNHYNKKIRELEQQIAQARSQGQC